MTTKNNTRLVDDYLVRLDAAGATAGLSPARRADLVADIREHIHDALDRADADDEVAVRNVLERLGAPEEIAAAAADPRTPAAPDRRRVGILEVAALLALLIPFLGWAIGGLLVLLSSAWTWRDKDIAVSLSAVAFVLTALLPLLVGPGSGLGPLEGGLLALGFLGAPIAALYLAWRLRRPGSR